ncbi:MAG: methyltransferase domain-containing protein [Oscillospiraceae bacterium]|nr:methyltransferase domain-containing protein [Oscillospiraceae bacterium]
MTTDEKLARSLTSETTELIPFLPYLLQDLWELGMSPRDIIKLIKKHTAIPEGSSVLELACGKGAAAVNIAKEFGTKVYGYDLILEFIEYAGQKAAEWGVEALCRFKTGDANGVVNAENNHGCVIFGAAGDILGNPQETMQKLSGTIKSGGFIIMDATYLPDDMNNGDIGWSYEYLHRGDWLRIFGENNLSLVEEMTEVEEYDFGLEMNSIIKRANELSEKYPDMREMFEGYIRSQQSEVEDLENTLVAGVWLLQKN